MNRVFCIDPGSEQSGWAILESGKVVDSGVHPNDDMLPWLRHGQHCEMLALEMIESRGNIVGQSTIDTAVWAGRFLQAYTFGDGMRIVAPTYRRTVKMRLCGNTQAKDTNVRQAVIDRLGPPGTKKAPGNTYGVKSHAWQALAVGLAALDSIPTTRLKEAA